MTWTRRQILSSIPAAALLAQKKGAPVGPKPNIVLILADDLAAWMLGCYGNEEIHTPNIDGLARSGTRFINHLVATPISSASRATLFTGRLPRQHGIIDFLTPQPEENPPQGQAAPPASFASEVMISDLLSQAGYQCGYAGKWHLGNDANPGHGFKYSYTFEGDASRYQDPVMYLNGEKVQEEGYLAQQVTRRACEFIDKQSSGTPFFLVVAHANPHPPYDGHPLKYYEPYKNSQFDSFGTQPAAPNALRDKLYLNSALENLRKTAAAVTALDDQIPPLMKKLRDKEFGENTIVILTSATGSLLGRHGLWGQGHASNPINMYDEAVKTPMIWFWSGKVPVHASRPELVSACDLVPSLCEAAGISRPGGDLKGVSYWTFASGHELAKGERWKDIVFGQFRNTDMARDSRYKLVVRNGGEGPNELFDLRTDPREKVNQYDNPTFLSMRDRLTKALAEWRK